MEKDLTKGPILKHFCCLHSVILGNLLPAQIYKYRYNYRRSCARFPAPWLPLAALHTDDISDFRHDRALHGMRRCFPCIWCWSSEQNERMHVDLLLADPAGDRHYVPDQFSGTDGILNLLQTRQTFTV